MEKLEKFVEDLQNNRYAGFDERVPDVKKEFVFLMSLLGANTGTSPYSNLGKVIDWAEGCNFQKMIKFKVDAITEYRQLKEDYERLQNSARKGNVPAKTVPSQGQQPKSNPNAKQESPTKSVRQDSPTKNHSKSKPPTVGNPAQQSPKSPVKTSSSGINGQSYGQGRRSDDHPITSPHSPTKKSQGGKPTPSTETIRKQEEEIENLRNRLSKVAGQKLHDGNPSIADLSDPMRPNKIAEYFSELYDNEFTEAFNELCMGGIGEEKAIKILNKILKGAIEYTFNTSDVQLNSLMLRFVHPREEDKVHIPENIKEDLKRHTRNIQRESASYAVSSLCKGFISSNKELNSDVLKMYAWGCVHLTWYMNVQTPKLYLHWDKEGTIMGDHVKPYTKSGTVIDYVVWPTLFLHIDGPVLLKGIVQPK